ncbi:inositol phosphoceramide mannosyltransferase 2-like isoform X3 [Biomphalaria pfeifferi]|uniref:Inositol phosphoceramide mannosyltransferase 2-like isoform X3 n=1 Tax=Biomphalaria pfeifferi TaxID=112525 RepID=A0AAD8BHR1_BIOPF|nr:inositol phosphoceramide mannosyltransferase 2-like isoform X3 [Biomphalaria pfeifferi]
MNSWFSLLPWQCRRITKREYFPSSGTPKIPKIIHQVWKGIFVPPEFVSWIKSWNKHHPDWEYWLWTDKSARQFIADRYPHLLNVYDNYPENIRRADAFRYIVLYEYGGLYADMDMEALGSFLPLTLKYSCFIGKEPYEHPIIDTNFDELLINALMGCRQKHPFMKLLLNNLASFSRLWHYLDSTGPHYVTLMYRQYKSSISLEKDDDTVYISPSEYFYPTIDPAKFRYMFNKCQNTQKLSELQIHACMNLKYKSLPENKFDPVTIAFANHHWYHTYLKTMSTVLTGYKSIFDIVPRVNIYNDLEE